MKKWRIIIIIIAILIGIFFSYNLSSPEITSFDKCVTQGNPVMESYPRQCRANGKTFVEDIIDSSENTKCLPKQREVDFCTEIYQPVCATVNIQCVTTPCDPIKETFANSCKACINSLASDYSKGEC